MHGAILAAVGLALVARTALGQRVEARRAKTIVVGTPAGPSPTDRVDAARTGSSRVPLPTGTLHPAWHKNVGYPIESAPLVDARGDITILTARGDLMVFAADGEERSDTIVGSAAAGPATLLSDGTAAFLSTASDVVGVHLGRVRFRAHVGGGRSAVSPLALADGGLVVATAGELVALDGEGNIRARAPLDPEDPAAHALVGGDAPDGPTVYVVTSTGAVFAWVPAAGRDVARVGTFRAPTDGGMALVGGQTLVAVVGSELVALDALSGRTTSRAVASASGALALLGPPSVRGSVVSLLGLTPSRTIALAFDAAGAETIHQAVAPTILPALQDGGVVLGSIPPHVGTLVDPQGDMAFTLPSGELGVVSPAGSVDLLDEICSRSGGPSSPPRGGPTYAGMAPAAPSAIVVTCGSGIVARIDSDFAPSP
jgi:hypothetical protein